jgi:hypothetical protein
MRNEIVLDIGSSAKGHIDTASALAWVVNAINRRIDDGIAIPLVQFRSYIRIGNDEVRCGDVRSDVCIESSPGILKMSELHCRSAILQQNTYLCSRKVQYCLSWARSNQGCAVMQDESADL